MTTMDNVAATVLVKHSFAGSQYRLLRIHDSR
jgi:hypothetical protein